MGKKALSEFVGTRTLMKVLVGKNIRQQNNFDVFEDYFTDSSIDTSCVENPSDEDNPDLETANANICFLPDYNNLEHKSSAAITNALSNDDDARKNATKKTKSKENLSTVILRRETDHQIILKKKRKSGTKNSKIPLKISSVSVKKHNLEIEKNLLNKIFDRAVETQNKIEKDTKSIRVGSKSSLKKAGSLVELTSDSSNDKRGPIQKIREISSNTASPGLNILQNHEDTNINSQNDAKTKTLKKRKHQKKISVDVKELVETRNSDVSEKQLNKDKDINRISASGTKTSVGTKNGKRLIKQIDGNENMNILESNEGNRKLPEKQINAKLPTSNRSGIIQEIRSNDTTATSAPNILQNHEDTNINSQNDAKTKTLKKRKHQKKISVDVKELVQTRNSDVSAKQLDKNKDMNRISASGTRTSVRTKNRKRLIEQNDGNENMNISEFDEGSRKLSEKQIDDKLLISNRSGIIQEIRSNDTTATSASNLLQNRGDKTNKHMESQTVEKTKDLKKPKHQKKNPVSDVNKITKHSEVQAVETRNNEFSETQFDRNENINSIIISDTSKPAKTKNQKHFKKQIDFNENIDMSNSDDGPIENSEKQIEGKRLSLERIRHIHEENTEDIASYVLSLLKDHEDTVNKSAKSQTAEKSRNWKKQEQTKKNLVSDVNEHVATKNAKLSEKQMDINENINKISISDISKPVETKARKRSRKQLDGIKNTINRLPILSSPKKQIKKMSKKLFKEDASAKDLRRSARQHRAPLDYWRSERVVYQFTSSVEVEVLGIEPGTRDFCDFTDLNKKKKRKAKPTEKKRQYPVKKIKEDPTKERALASVSQNEISVYDPYTEEEILSQVFQPTGTLDWKGPSDKSLYGYQIAKTFQTDSLVHGFIRIGGFKRKPPMKLSGYSAIFTLIRGTVEVGIHRTMKMLYEEDTFLVPAGNIYSISNLLETECLLTYTASEEPLPELMEQ